MGGRAVPGGRPNAISAIPMSQARAASPGSRWTAGDFLHRMWINPLDILYARVDTTVMKNTGRQPIIGTLRSQGAKDVEYVKKCAECGGTLIVEKWELSKDRHEMCEESK